MLGTAHLAEIAIKVEGADAHPAYTRVLAEAGWAVASAVTDCRAASCSKPRSPPSAPAHGLPPRPSPTCSRGQLGRRGGQATRPVAGEGLALAEASGDLVATTGLRSAYASMLAIEGRQAEAQEQAQQALDDARALRQPTLEVAALFSVGEPKFRTDPHDAMAALRASLELGRQHHNQSERGAALA